MNTRAASGELLGTSLPIAWMRLSIRLGFLLGLYILYDLFDWGFLHQSLRAITVALLEATTDHVVTLGTIEPRSSGIWVDGSAYRITRGCTYANLALTVAPFLWRFDRKFTANVLLIVVFAAAVLVVDAARLALAVHLHSGGASWALAHDWPNRLLRYSTVVPAVLFALIADHAEVRMTSGREQSRECCKASDLAQV